MKIKSLVIVAILTIAIFGFGVARAQTTDTATLIAQLQAQIASLMAQLKALQSQQGGTSQPWCHTFNNYLVAGSTSSDVSSLQTALNKEGFDVADDDSGAFGDSTAAAVVEFQGKYGITQTGTVGPKTRAKLNSLYGCNGTPSPANQCTVDSDCPIATLPCAPGTTSVGPKCVNGSCTPRQCISQGCTPNWSCTWGKCINGSQSQTQVDLNNCGITTNVPSCPAITQQCNSNQCGQLIYFCADNSPYCTPTNSMIDQYTQNSGCVTVTKRTGPDFINLLNTDELALKYKITAVPTFLFINKDGCSGKLLENGNRTLENLKNEITNFKCNAIAPSITLLSPNGGETWLTGSKQTVLWKSQGIDINTPITIGLWDTNNQPIIIAKSVTNDGTEEITVPDVSYFKNIAVPPNKYKLGVSTSIVPNAGLDSSDNYFTITTQSAQPLLTVTSPNGGEQWAQGSTHNITWNLTNIPSNYTLNLGIEDYSGANTVSTFIARVPASQSSYSWTIPLTLSGNKFKIDIGFSDASGNFIGNGISASYFSIVNP